MNTGAENPKQVFRLLPRNNLYAYDENDDTTWTITPAEAEILLAKDVIAPSTGIKGVYYARWWADNDDVNKALAEIRRSVRSESRQIIEAEMGEDPKSFLTQFQRGKQQEINRQAARAWDRVFDPGATGFHATYENAWQQVLRALVPGADPAMVKEAADLLNVRGHDAMDELDPEEAWEEARGYAAHCLPQLTHEQILAIEALWRSVYL